MKKLFLTLFVLSLLPTLVQADPITPQRAKQIAADFAGITAPRQVQRRRDAQSMQKNLPLYVFSRGENQGYVFVSGSDCLPEIIGYTDSGDFDEATASPTLLAYLDHYTKMAEASEAQSMPARVARKAAGTKNIKPLLTCHWHQSWPYNNMCPYVPGTTNLAATGCVATAASQILYYWRKDLPERTLYATPTYNGWSNGESMNADVTVSIPAGTPWKWDLMKDSYSGSDPKEYTDAAALLNYVIGTCDYMGYHNASGAYIWDLVNPFKNQFKLESREIRRNNGGYSQASWEKVIIDNLENSYPMEYAGYTTDWSGHAIVLDGYQINGNLFHFNFGWGGQGDGYYTVEESGVNGFGMDQALVVDIHPSKPNVEGRIIECPDMLLSRVENDFVVEVTNNGTLPMKGVYLYCLSGTKTPASATSVQASDKNVVIGVGETKRITLSYAPPTTSNYSLYLTDVNKNVLDKKKDVAVSPTVATLTLKGIETDGSETEEMIIQGEKVRVHRVYNTGKTIINAILSNAADATYCMPSIKVECAPYNEDTDAFGTAMTKTLGTTTFMPGETSTVQYSLPFSSLSSNKIEDGVVYRFQLSGTASTNRSYPITFETPDSVVYFKLVGTDMEAKAGADSLELVMSGHYNAQVFSSMATDSTISRYDLTSLAGLNSVPSAANPNALFYVNAEQGVNGRNTIVDGVADELELTPGYNFVPTADFTALKSTYHATQAIGQFGTAYLPFDCSVPNGMMAQNIKHVGNSSISEVDSCCHELKSGTPYLILSSKAVDLVAQNALVSTSVPSTSSDSLKGVWTNQVADDTQWVLDDADIQYFSPYKGKVIPALTAYMLHSRKIRVYESSLLNKMKKAKTLAKTLALGYAAIEEYAKTGKAADLQTLQQAVNDAEAKLTAQPVIDELAAASTAIEEAIEGVKNRAHIIAANGFVDKTGFIVNPSFEASTPTKGWHRTDQTGKSITTIKGSKITLSQSVYMSGADGVEVMIIPAGGNVLSQIVENLPNGTYQMVVGVSANYDKQMQIFAGEDTVTVEASDFGPYYLKDAVVDDVKVTDGTLRIGAISLDGQMKVDNFRLYLKEADEETAIEVVEADADYTPKSQKGIYDMMGRRISAVRQSGVYIIDGRKVLK